MVSARQPSGPTGGTVAKPGTFETMRGHDVLSSAVLVDQSPLGRTARGNAARPNAALTVIITMSPTPMR